MIVLQRCSKGVKWWFNCVLMPLHWCYRGEPGGLTVVLIWCYSGVTVVLERCYSGVTVL
jgi:hypothetical protein